VLSLERLEDRYAPAVALSYGGTGTALTLSESALGKATIVTISQSDPQTLDVQLSSGTFAATSSASAPGLTYVARNGHSGPGFSTEARIQIGAANAITTLTTYLADDQLKLGAISDSTGGIGNLNAAAGSIVVEANAVINTSAATAGKGNINLTAATSLKLNAGAALFAGDGSIRLTANGAATPAAGNFSGINLVGATVKTTGAGNITLTGRGGNDANSDFHIGVWIQGQAQVESLGTGTLTIVGTGGQGRSNNIGVDVQDSGTLVSSATGAINMTGVGGIGTSFSNHGILIFNGGLVTEIGRAPITLTGTGGQGAGLNEGVYLLGVSANGSNQMAQVMSATGNVTFNGSTTTSDAVMIDDGMVSTSSTGGNGSVTLKTPQNVILQNGATVSAGGGGTVALTAAQNVAIVSGSTVSTADGALIVTANRATTPQSGNFIGINVDDSTVETTGAGALLLSGRGGNDANSDFHIGVYIHDSATVESLGTGTLTLVGTGGTGTLGNYGVAIIDSSTVVSSVAGAIHVAGTAGNGTGDFNIGTWVYGGAQVLATGTASITLTGTGGQGTDNDYGVEVTGSGTLVRSANGAITLTGTGGTGGSGNNLGIAIYNGGQVSSTGSAPITLTGTGGQGAATDAGVQIFGVLVNGVNAVSAVTSASGNITINGSATSGEAIQVGDAFIRTSSNGGAGTVTLNAAQNVLIESGSMLSTADGALTIVANLAATPQSGNFCGINVIDSTVETTGVGALLLKGRGGNDPNSGFHAGVVIQASATVESLGNGTLTLIGTGGQGTGNNYGVDVQDSGTLVTSGGAITMTGVAGDGTSYYNIGTFIYNGGQVTETGSARITLNGTGGQGAGFDEGVFVWGTTSNGTNLVSQVTSASGNIALNGSATAGDAVVVVDGIVSTSGSGTVTLDAAQNVLILDGSQVSSADGALTVVANLAATPQNGNFDGINVADATVETTGAGNLLLQGHGGNDANSGYHLGVYIHDSATVESLGTGALTLVGTGGQGTSNNIGVDVQDSGTLVSAAGAITITGVAGNGTGYYDIGTTIYNGGQVTETGSARIILTGTGGQGAGFDDGVLVWGTNSNGTNLVSQVTSASGNITLNGSATAGDAVAVLDGVVSTSGAGTIALNAAQNVFILGGSTVSSADGALTIVANLAATPQSGNFSGINVDGSAVETTGAGNLLLEGRGGNDPNSLFHVGVIIQDQATVESLGTGTLTLLGYGGSGTAINYGVDIVGSGTVVSSVSGAIHVTGTAGNGTGDFNVGTEMLGGAQIIASGTASITVSGTGGQGTFNNEGVDLGGSGTLVSSAGAIRISGVAGNGTSTANTGIIIYDSGQVTETGSASMTLTGTGGQGTGADDGVDVNGGQVSSATGNISLIGSVTSGTALVIHAATVSSSSNGGAGTVTLNAAQNVLIESGSTVSTADGALTVVANQATAAQSGNFSGITIDSSTVETTGAGRLLLAGRGGNDPNSGVHVGVLIQDSAKVQSLGTGTLTLVGTGGTGTSENYGVAIFDGGTVVSSVSGAIAVTGTAGNGTGGLNVGIWVNGGAQVLATGSAPIRLTGTGGQGSDNDYGVNVYGSSSMVRSANGAITLTGTGGSGGSGNNLGIAIYYGGQVACTGSAPITLTGTGGQGAATDDGVQILGVLFNGVNAVSAVTSASGNITINGSATSGDAIQVGDALIRTSSTSGAGTVALNATQNVLIESGSMLSTADGALTIVANLAATPQSGNFSGINVDDSTVETTGAGALLLHGRGGNDINSGWHVGVLIHDQATVEALGTGTLTLLGTGGAGTASNIGVDVQDSGTLVSAAGAITMTGVGGNGTSYFNIGTTIYNGGQVTETGSASITLNGTGGHGAGVDEGVIVWGTTSNGTNLVSQVTSVSGNITFNGSATAGDAVAVVNGVVSTSGSGAVTLNAAQNVLIVSASTVSAADGALTIESNLAAPQSGNFGGIDVDDSTVKTTGAGALLLAGRGGNDPNSGFHVGVLIQNQATVESLGTGALTIVGTGGTGTSANDGVAILFSGTVLSSVSGAINLTGTAGNGTEDSNVGISVFGGAHVLATGTASITLNGTGGEGTRNNYGVDVVGIGTFISSAAGGIQLNGVGNGTAGGSIGIAILYGPKVTSTGSAPITLNGTGGQGTGSNYGVDVEGSITLVSSAGPIHITGVAGNGTSLSNIGILLFNGGQVIETGSAPIILSGTGGSGTSGDFGVEIAGTVTTSTGALTITGTATDGLSNDIEIAGAVTAGGTMTLTGSTVAVDAGASLTGSGRLLLQPPGPAGSLTLLNFGSIAVGGNVTAANGTTVNTEDGGSVTVGGSFNWGLYSALTTLAGSTFSVTGAFVMGPGSSFTDDGTLSVGGAFDPGAGYPGVNNTVGGTFNALAGSNISTDAATFEILAGGHVDVAAGANFVVPLGATLQEDTGGLLSVEGKMTVAGTLSDAARSAVVVDGPGSLVVKTGGQLSILGTYLVWQNPASIALGAALGAAQLNATATTLVNGLFVPVPGSFTYNPTSGTMLPLGNNQPLLVTFSPSDTSSFAGATAQVFLNVLPAPTMVVNPVNMTYGTALDNSQLSGTYNGQTVAGTFTYTSAAGAVLNGGNGQMVSVTFTPADTVHYATVTTTVTVNVAQATPSVIVNPVSITYGTALADSQLTGTASFTVGGSPVVLTGTYTYTSAGGTVLGASATSYNEAVTFTPADSTDFAPVSTTVSVTVAKADPTLTWANPAPILATTALSDTQLNATANVLGSPAYTPAAGTLLSAGTQTLSVTFTPTDTIDYNTVTQTAQITVVGAGVTVVGTELWLVGGTTTTDDRLQINPAGASKTGGTGVQVTGKLNGSAINQSFTQSFTAIRVFFYGGSRLSNVHAAGSLTVSVVSTHINEPPAITQAASASPSVVTGMQTQLQVQAADPQGSTLSYAWTVTSQPTGAAAPKFVHAASNSTKVTFTQAGSYTFAVTVTDALGLSVTSSVTVQVD
jgi:hypothetical protein